ncbi:DNA-directed RNA polymerase III subunit RPC9 [Diorhabda carinulata]|uniref:DNA-directed RNA polymerase III subunit RPC9 n=1 Tax=Diorhabda carinulata TaxID=1163345 RepID=UPI0025A23E13|nr:DNA-directed RNA polymerase III subunit RPC9 [Diorhabda carinulata]
MEIVNSNCASLSNYEVFKHLQKIKDGKKKHKGQLATITYETLRYLETTHINDQSADSIKNCMKDLSAFNLSKTELLMIINSPPSTAIDIQLMVEESEERLTEEQVQDILEIVAKHFPYVVKEKVEEDNEEELE